MYVYFGFYRLYFSICLLGSLKNSFNVFINKTCALSLGCIIISDKQQTAT